MNDLPIGWEMAPIGVIADVVSGQAPPGTSYNASGQGLPLYQGKADFGELHIREPRLWTTSPSKLAEKDDVLLSVRAPVGPTNLSIGRCAIGRGLAAIRGRCGVEQKYLLYAIRATVDRLTAQATGTTFSAITGPVVRNHVIPLAPIGEQKRMIAAIEEQFSRIDSGILALERVRNNLARLRTLGLLFFLTKAEDGLRDRDSANDWSWSSLADLSLNVVDCEHWTPNFVSDGVPCIDTTCISPGRIHQDQMRFVDQDTYRRRVRRIVPQASDIVFAREGTVGTAVVMPPGLSACLGQRVMLCRPDPSRVDSDYLCLVLNSELVKKQYRSLIIGTTAPHLNVRDIKLLRIQLPPIDVQRTVAARTTRMESLIAAIENAASGATTRARDLRSSILSAAFSGNLVGQDHSDEPAATLVARIASQRRGRPQPPGSNSVRRWDSRLTS